MNDERFMAARQSVLTPDARERHGIGMQKEKTLHAVFKNYEDPDPDHQEIPLVGNFVADIFDGKTVIEIQNGNFGHIRERLAAFLPLYPVRVVYPIPHIKYITWVDPETGELGKRSKSPRKGTFYDGFEQLYKIKPFLRDPNLTIDLVLTDMEEYRLRDGWDRSGKRGSHRFDRVPTAIAEELVLESPGDYLAFVPYDLAEPFTAAEMAKSAGFRRDGFSGIVKLLTELGVLTRTGKRGRAYLYSVCEEYKNR